VSIAPHEICRRLGEARFKEMFLSLNAAAMKGSLMEAGLSTTRNPSQTSTKKRNEEWARRLWQSLQAPKPAPCKVLLFEWLRQTRGELLTAFLDAIEVPHSRGLTDADFMNQVPEEKLVQAAKLLLAHPKFDRRDVAAYLLFLDATNETSRFSGLELDKTLQPQ
jgi:hypothetical protein